MSNWINLEIKGKRYYLLCKLNEKNEWDCLLYDGNESWYEKQMLETIIARAKEHNRRIQYDEATIKETLQSAKPTEAVWLADNGDATNISLKLKYQIKACPFNFTWHFSRQSEHDFQKFILFPLFRIVQGLTEQNKELREIVRKKDIEVMQYKYEFGLLKRVTVSTKPFDAVDFDERYAETLELSKCMMQISNLLKAQYSQLETPLKAKAVDKVDDTTDAKRKGDVKLTPRKKRRKLIEEQKRVIVEKLQARKKPFAYESSQSQMSSISQSDTELPTTSKRLLRSPRKRVELKIENDLNETPTKCKSIQNTASEQSPAKLLKRNLSADLENDTSSDEELKPKNSSNKNLLQARSQRSTEQQFINKLAKATTDSSATDAAAATSSKKIASTYDSTDSNVDEAKSTKPANTTEIDSISKKILSCLSRSSSCASNGQTSPVKLTRNTASIGVINSVRTTRKNAVFEYEDSSESGIEEKALNKSSPLLNAFPTKVSNSKISPSPEQLSDDVQHLINEWKDLEKRRLADLKIRQN